MKISQDVIVVLFKPGPQRTLLFFGPTNIGYGGLQSVSDSAKNLNIFGSILQ